MHTLLLTTNTVADAKQLADFLSKIKTVKSVTIDPPLKEEKWVNPLSPLTDDEHEKLLDEAESGPFMTAEEAEEYSKELLAQLLRA
jgi:type IV secretory pathway TrbF-like protein